MTRRKLVRTFATPAGSMAAAVALAAEPHSQYNLQPPVSIIAEQIYDLHTLIMWIIVGIFVLVFGVMTIAIALLMASAFPAILVYAHDGEVEWVDIESGEVTATDFAGMLSQGHDIAGIDPHMIVKIFRVA